MEKNRLEAFSDGVLAIIITIMVLEMKVPHAGGASWDALRPLAPVFLSYVLSFLYVGIYWNNHHHLLQTTRRVNGVVLWANLHLLFWLSLFPFCAAWMGQNDRESLPAALYGFVLLMAALAYYLLQLAIMRQQGPNSVLAAALGSDWKGKLSVVSYLIAVPLAFVHPWLAAGSYGAVALVWLIPDQRIERALAERGGEI
jgi:uncharacterized membrane protein